MKGLIFNVRRYSIHDGPGIRVTFFLKGCPLSCWWCHNPEGLNPQPETVEVTEKVGERNFVKNELAGQYYTAGGILRILEKERIFISQSNGGVTFSGGEPMLQTEFLLEALKACKASGFHTAVDTSGYSQTKKYSEIIPFTDLFLFDLKHPGDEKHILYTGVSNKLIISNFKYLLESRKDIMVRIPVIPGFNDDWQSLTELRELLAKSAGKNLKKICLLPYHRIGASKYKRFNIPSRMDNVIPPSRERMNELKAYFSETGIKVKIGG
jgi:pyruvate formate lyase activating enzyme